MNDRTLTALIVITVLAVVGWLVYRDNLEDEALDTRAPKAEVEIEKRTTHVHSWLTDCNRSGNSRMIANGLIRNAGTTDLHYVTVKVLWINAQGLLVEANELYALNNEVLKPGETVGFTDTTEKLSATQCNVESVDWW
jgi:hypothetical protein